MASENEHLIQVQEGMPYSEFLLEIPAPARDVVNSTAIEMMEHGGARSATMFISGAGGTVLTATINMAKGDDLTKATVSSVAGTASSIAMGEVAAVTICPPLAAATGPVAPVTYPVCVGVSAAAGGMCGNELMRALVDAYRAGENAGYDMSAADPFWGTNLPEGNVTISADAINNALNCAEAYLKDLGNKIDIAIFLARAGLDLLINKASEYVNDFIADVNKLIHGLMNGIDAISDAVNNLFGSAIRPRDPLAIDLDGTESRLSVFRAKILFCSITMAMGSRQAQGG